MTSYQILPSKTAEELLCRLISWGYDTEDNILKKPYHVIMRRYKWFEKLEKEKRDYEEKMRFTCPFAGKKRK